METTKQENNNAAVIDDHKLQKLVDSLERLTNWDGRALVQYEGFLTPSLRIRSIVSFRENFRARENDVVLASLPKSGTTWLKALTFSIANRNVHKPNDRANHPLLAKNPHELVTFFEYLHHSKVQKNPEELESVEEPRIFGTHMPYSFLPDSIRVIYICRNPLDQFVSYRHFSLENFAKGYESALGVDEALELYLRGVHSHGPFWAHNLGYWNASKENPDKVLFLKYEDLKEDTAFYVRKIAEFLGFLFTSEEEERGVPDEIVRLCSFESLSGLEVNKNGSNGTMSFRSLFRKGEVGDWRNYVSGEAAERAKTIVESKFTGSGLNFEI